MVVAGKKLVRFLEAGLVVPRPHHDEASIRLHLGDDFIQYDPVPTAPVVLPRSLPTQPVPLDNDGRLVLGPAKSVLACTREKVNLPLNLMGWVSTKGNLARSFLTVHVCDGQIDPGFFGQITLEIVNLGPLTVALSPGMVIANLNLFELDDPVECPYSGRFQHSAGPAPMTDPTDRDR